MIPNSTVNGSRGAGIASSRYPSVLPRHQSADGPLNPYYFVDQVFRRLAPDDVGDLRQRHGQRGLLPGGADPQRAKAHLQFRVRFNGL